MEFKDLLYKRRSCREYTGQNITKAQLDYILAAAVQAPSACNLQSWHFNVITGVKAVRELSPKLTPRCEWIKNCSLVIVVSTDSEGIEKLAGERGRDLYSLQDTACAMENILLAAADMGLGGCFIGSFDDNGCREALGLSERFRPVAVAAIGTIDHEPGLREHRPLSDVVEFIGEMPE